MQQDPLAARATDLLRHGIATAVVQVGDDDFRALSRQCDRTGRSDT
jgi:hypothetical protein